MSTIICLANSWKNGERCIAGIDIETSEWIRPVCDAQYPDDGRVPRSVRLVEGREPELLDILEIPLAETGKDFGFECENRSVLPGQWNYLGKVESADLLKYCLKSQFILHNSWKYVKPSFLQRLPLPNRLTLQLVHAVSFSVERKEDGWRGTIQGANGQSLPGAKITDPVLVKKLEAGCQAQSNCLATVSLGLPWKPASWENEDEAPCWKLIAGVMEL
jgi:hypothetical protein